jgi:hypothetical protein
MLNFLKYVNYFNQNFKKTLALLCIKILHVNVHTKNVFFYVGIGGSSPAREDHNQGTNLFLSNLIILQIAHYVCMFVNTPYTALETQLTV